MCIAHFRGSVRYEAFPSFHVFEQLRDASSPPGFIDCNERLPYVTGGPFHVMPRRFVLKVHVQICAQGILGCVEMRQQLFGFVIH